MPCISINLIAKYCKACANAFLMPYLYYMKFWVFILAFHLCTLSVQPVLVQAISSMGHNKSCCGNKCSKSKPFSCPAGCPNNGACKVCLGSVGVYTVNNALNLTLLQPSIASPVAGVTHRLTSNYMVSCFHPPETI